MSICYVAKATSLDDSKSFTHRMQVFKMPLAYSPLGHVAYPSQMQVNLSCT